MMERSFERTAPEITLALLRIAAGLLFMQHGAQKLLGWFGGTGPDGGTAELFSRYGAAGVIELFGGLLIAVGLLTRIVALIASGEMFVAFLIAHVPRGWVPIENGGELALLYAFVFLFFAARGAGAYSLDALLGRESAEAEVYEHGVA